MSYLFHSLRPSFNKNDHYRRPHLPASSLPASFAIHLSPPFFTARTCTPHLDAPLLVLPTTIVSSATKNTTPNIHVLNNISSRSHEVEPQSANHQATTDGTAFGCDVLPRLRAKLLAGIEVDLWVWLANSALWVAILRREDLVVLLDTRQPCNIHFVHVERKSLDT